MPLLQCPWSKIVLSLDQGFISIHLLDAYDILHNEYIQCTIHILLQ